MKDLLTADIMRAALQALDEKLAQKLSLIIGGGGAMLLAHGYPLATTDIDAIPKGMEIGELDIYVKKIAAEKNLPIDWLNPYFSTFSFTLPKDYQDRLIQVFSGKNLSAHALGKEDLLVMKCFAHRQKDIGHAKKLIKDGANLELVEDQIQGLLEKKVRGAQEALDFFDELTENI